jgi:toxin ParE1/3/4
MKNLRFSNQSREDLRNILDFIASENRTAAYRELILIERACKNLLFMPSMGRLRREIDPRVRSFPCSSYVIFYYAVDGGIEIARIYHASRDPDEIF